MWPWVFIFYNLKPRNTCNAINLTIEKNNRICTGCYWAIGFLPKDLNCIPMPKKKVLSLKSIISLHTKWKMYIYILFPVELYVPEFLYQLLNSLKPETNKIYFLSVFIFPILFYKILGTEHNMWLIFTSESKEFFLPNTSYLCNQSKLINK